VILAAFELLAEAASHLFGGLFERLGWREKRDPRNFPPPR
jgi:hypothetical protein